jgi:nucleotide-binding universal stress UspA family protein
MFLRSLLIPTAPGINATLRLEAATRLGKKLHAHLNVLFVSPDPERFLATLPEVSIAAGVNLQSLRQEIRDAATSGRASLEAWCEGHGIRLTSGSERLDATFATWNEAVGDLEAVVAITGRVNDLAILERPDPADPFTERVFDAALFSSGRPVLVIGRELPQDFLDHVVIAWNGSLEAARAVGQSIALLHEAQRVTVIAVRTERARENALADLPAYMRWHGIVAHAHHLDLGSGASVGDTILAEAERINATLLMSGAFTHSRLREFFLGGVTRDLITKAKVALLLAH